MKLRITVQGVAYEVEVEVIEGEDEAAPAVPLPHVTPSISPSEAAVAPARGAMPAPVSARPPAVAMPAATGMVASPIAGTVINVLCKAGDEVQAGQTLLVIEAMKMETAIAAPATGKLKTVGVATGDTVRENQVLVEFD